MPDVVMGFSLESNIYIYTVYIQWRRQGVVDGGAVTAQPIEQ